jgi:acyl-coenzyme A synthetase/AMP-(fatty) acid ligase
VTPRIEYSDGSDRLSKKVVGDIYVDNTKRGMIIRYTGDDELGRTRVLDNFVAVADTDGDVILNGRSVDNVHVIEKVCYISKKDLQISIASQL